MSQIFWAQSKDGKLSLGSEYNASRFRDFLQKHPGIRFKIDPLTPESRKQRNFFEGAVVPLIAYYQSNIDYKDHEDCRKVRDWLKIEFNGTFITLGGKAVKIPKSTKGELNRGFLERILEWMDEQGYQTELLLPADYKKWKEEIFPNGGPDNYIDYLLEIGKLRRK